MHGVENEKIVEKTENSIALEFIIPESSDFFDGHFPEFKLLPAVAQFEIVTRFSRKYFGTDRAVPAIRRIKFSNPIRPESQLHLEIKYNREKSSVSYTLRCAKNSEKTYSSGSFSVTSCVAADSESYKNSEDNSRGGYNN